MNFDELHCRVQSIIDYFLGREGQYFVLDSDKNLYIRGKKYKNQKTSMKTNFNNKEYDLVDIKNGVRFYIKKV